MAVFASLATFTTFAALVLEIFSIIGSTYNRAFLRDLYFVQFKQGSDFINFGLWNYCTGTGNQVTQCSTPQAAFVWNNAESLGRYFQNSIIQGHESIYMANFILYWIAFGLTALALIVTLLSHFRRSADLVAAFASFVSFLVLLASFVIILVISLRGFTHVGSGDAVTTIRLGPSTWMTLGAVAGLLVASLAYCVSCCFGSGRRVRGTDEDKA
ncbi:hypothetical protein DFQ30_005048 [Apophysomyces sp. BC1015]|nr:hypothetical protein DFQ30_005048 [Apophysomyces sp. BC1015]